MQKSIGTIDQHQDDYKPQAWEAYTFAELGQWVHLLAKRSEHRDDPVKRKKDLYDARNYAEMLSAKLKVLEDAAG